MVIDEAAQATEPAVLVPLGLNGGRSCVRETQRPRDQKMEVSGGWDFHLSPALGFCWNAFEVLLGDHLQLPPTVFLPRADELFVSRSLFERLCVMGGLSKLLITC